MPSARKLDQVTYEEMLELAAGGAKILHLRCVEYARRYDIPIHVRSSFSQLTGTLVKGSINDEAMPVNNALPRRHAPLPRATTRGPRCS